MSTAGVTDVGAADRAQRHLAEPPADDPEGLAEAECPCLLEAGPVLVVGSDGLLLSARRDLLEERVHLVPLQLVGDQGRDEVVDVRRRSDEGCDRLLAVVVPAAPPGRCLDLLPAEDVDAQLGADRTGALAEDDAAGLGYRRRQPAHRVDQGAHVDAGLGGERVEGALHPHVGLLEGVEANLAGALQHGRVGAHVELDGVPAGPDQVSWRGLHAGQSIGVAGCPRHLQKVYP